MKKVYILFFPNLLIHVLEKPEIVVHDFSGVKHKRKIDRFRKILLNSKERRKSNLSLSIDDDNDSFLDALTDAEKKSIENKKQRISLERFIELPQTKIEEERLDDISKKEQELKLRMQRLAEREREANERTLIDMLIKLMKPTFNGGIKFYYQLIIRITN